MELISEIHCTYKGPVSEGTKQQTILEKWHGFKNSFGHCSEFQTIKLYKKVKKDKNVCFHQHDKGKVHKLLDFQCYTQGNQKCI
jgi:hypothetical protein